MKKIRSSISLILAVSFVCHTCLPMHAAFAAACQTCSGASNSAVGSGDLPCGGCGNIVVTFILGSCVDSDSQSDTCEETGKYTVTTHVFVCDASGWGLIGAAAVTGACGAGILAGCAAACTVGGVFTFGSSCAACIAAATVVGGGCYCAVKELECPCTYSHATPSNPGHGCW